MYPSRFRYEAPRSIEDAIALLRDGAGEAKVLAGGQSLVPLLKLRFAAPEVLVDINNLPGLDYHRVDPDGTIRVGALCRHAELERSSILASKQPTMAAAAPLIADPIVRNRGTLVGSLCHADPQGDWAAVVTALGGSVIAQGSTGRRSIPVASFVSGPFQNTKLADLLKRLGDEANVSIIIDNKSFMDPAQFPVSVPLRNKVTLNAALTALADQYDVCFLFRDYGILATNDKRGRNISAPAIPRDLPLNPAKDAVSYPETK